MEGNYMFEPGQDKKSGCISTGCAMFLYLACRSRCQDKKIEASTCPFVPLETNELCLLLLFYVFMLLKVKWRESVWIQPRPVKYWHGALWRTISSYQSMWKWLIVLVAKRIPNWKAHCNIWFCHNTLLSLEFITLPSCACFHIVHRCWCLRRTTPCSSKTLWLSLYLVWQGDETC